ncbi:MAG TPA: DUF6178 family protein, partial [Myxococcota bacterium]|nr:DUF6178 family protein [Myxococcota bacterium]
VAMVLRANDMRSMIRVGRTALVNLRVVLRNTLHDKSLLMGENFLRADSPLREVARALMLPEPRFYEGLLNPKKLTIRFFSSLNELNATVKAMNELRFRAKLVGPEILGCNEAMLENHPTLSHANIYARYLINDFVHNSDPLGAINAADLKRVIGPNNQLKDDFIRHAKKYANALGHKFFEHSSLSLEQALEMTNNFSSAVLIRLEQNPILLLG